MRYERIIKGTFQERPNRFIAYAEVAGKRELVHVKNTGRCAELLKPGAVIYMQESENTERKTKWDLICVEKGERLINMDSQIPNKVVQEWVEAGNLFEDVRLVRPETTYGNSRFDLYVEAGEARKIFIEVKGVTLEENGVVRFPDAPSERAVKHLEELCKAVKDGFEAYVFFVIQMKGDKVIYCLNELSDCYLLCVASVRDFDCFHSLNINASPVTNPIHMGFQIRVDKIS